MRKTLLSSVALAMIGTASFAQTPQPTQMVGSSIYTPSGSEMGRLVRAIDRNGDTIYIADYQDTFVAINAQDLDWSNDQAVYVGDSQLNIYSMQDTDVVLSSIEESQANVGATATAQPQVSDDAQLAQQSNTAEADMSGMSAEPGMDTNTSPDPMMDQEQVNPDTLTRQARPMDIGPNSVPDASEMPAQTNMDMQADTNTQTDMDMQTNTGMQTQTDAQSQAQTLNPDPEVQARELEDTLNSDLTPDIPERVPGEDGAEALIMDDTPPTNTQNNPTTLDDVLGENNPDDTSSTADSMDSSQNSATTLGDVLGEPNTDASAQTSTMDTSADMSTQTSDQNMEQTTSGTTNGMTNDMTTSTDTSANASAPTVQDVPQDAQENQDMQNLADALDQAASQDATTRSAPQEAQPTESQAQDPNTMPMDTMSNTNIQMDATGTGVDTSVETSSQTDMTEDMSQEPDTQGQTNMQLPQADTQNTISTPNAQSADADISATANGGVREEPVQNSMTDSQMTQDAQDAQSLNEIYQDQALERAERETQQSSDAQATAETQDQAVNVQTETVDQGDTRRADQEYRQRDGISNFERVLMFGLGAVTAGSILNTGEEVVSNTGDRIVVREPNGGLRVLRDETILLRQAGDEVQTETYQDGSTRTVVTRPDGTRVVTIRAADGRTLRRERVTANQTVVLFDDTRDVRAVEIQALPDARERAVILDTTNTQDLRQALSQNVSVDRAFSLSQIRNIPQVRELANEIEVENVTFATGSAAITGDQARQLQGLGTVMNQLIDQNPGEVFLIEGHTDAVGSESSNLALSDRRAESMALALVQYMNVPPENLVTQGYGETELKVPTLGDERANRRVVVRRITPLLGTQ